MGQDANESRTLDLIRFETAAGAAFGCTYEEESRGVPFVNASAAIAVATIATAFAATITYLI